jgi:hypothetical protein
LIDLGTRDSAHAALLMFRDRSSAHTAQTALLTFRDRSSAHAALLTFRDRPCAHTAHVPCPTLCSSSAVLSAFLPGPRAMTEPHHPWAQLLAPTPRPGPRAMTEPCHPTPHLLPHQPGCPLLLWLPNMATSSGNLIWQARTAAPPSPRSSSGCARLPAARPSRGPRTLARCSTRTGTLSRRSAMGCPTAACCGRLGMA